MLSIDITSISIIFFVLSLLLLKGLHGLKQYYSKK
nr:MAG TPA: Semenogelin [Caudoviricetes sp.]